MRALINRYDDTKHQQSPQSRQQKQQQQQQHDVPSKWRQYMNIDGKSKSRDEGPFQRRSKKKLSYRKNDDHQSSSTPTSKKRSNETIIMLLSDHGSHMGPFYEFSRAGRQEHRLPLLMILVPNSLLLRYPRIKHALLHNRNALVTPYDIYHTLRHLLVYPHDVGYTPFSSDNDDSGHDIIANITITSPANLNKLPFMKSLLRPIPLDRTCAQAHIPASLCACSTPATAAVPLEPGQPRSPPKLT
jgi:arylsulfatase A-like enzyme